MKELALYIHIPFCKSKCYYCDFNSYPNKKELIPGYIKNLIEEIKMYKDICRDYTVKTIFIGGGTPSFIDGKYIYEIFESVYNNFNVDALEEVSLELNPKTVNSEKLKIYRDIGINRVSIGCQSLKDETLKNIGRIHTSRDFFNTYELLRRYGFDNINVDLMFGLPNQHLEDILYTLEKIVSLDVEHISFYSLIIEEGTKFYDWYNNDKLMLPDEDEERKMYHEGISYLKSKEYIHYEISNLAKKGYKCKHNLFYWELKPYIGFGLGAHSNINNKRYWNYEGFNDYFNSLKKGILPIEGEEIIDKQMEMAEYLILGLRLVKGISKIDFFNRFNLPVENVYGEILDKHFANGLLYVDEENIKLTKKGLDLSNLVFVDILP